MYIVERKQYTQLTKDKFMGDIYMKYRSRSEAKECLISLFPGHLAQKCRR